MGIRNLLSVCLFAVLLPGLPVPVHARNHHPPPFRDVSCTLPHPPQTGMALTGARAVVSFSPNGNGEALIVKAIAAARHSILVQAYSFTDQRILAALVRAKSRGVDVRVILDKTDTDSEDNRRPVATQIAMAGIPVWIDGAVNIAHNKVMILDGADVITGSYNFSYAANYDNAENLLYLQNAAALASAYEQNWRWRQSCSQPYIAGKTAG